MSDNFLHWLAGFTDGEGCFQIMEHHPGRYTTRFWIRLREDDLDILLEIQEYLGFGNVGVNPSYKNDGYDRPNGIARFVVCDKDGCSRLVEIFEHYPLRAKKKRDFEIWRDAVNEMQKAPNIRDEQYLSYLQRKLRMGRKHPGDGTNTEYPDYAPDSHQLELPLSMRKT